MLQTFQTQRQGEKEYSIVLVGKILNVFMLLHNSIHVLHSAQNFTLVTKRMRGKGLDVEDLEQFIG